MRDSFARLVRLGSRSRRQHEPPLVALPRDGRALPAGPVQERFWFLHHLAPTRPTYTVPFGFTITGPLDTDVLVAVLAEIERRHEVLRASLVERDGRLVHQVAAPSELPQLSSVDLTDMPWTWREWRAADLVEQTARTVFDPAGGPLLRAVLIRLSPIEHLLLWVAHPTVADSASLGVLATEIAGLYRQITDPVAPEAEPAKPVVQYPDYLAWQRERLTGARRDELTAYWTRQLADLPVLSLPTDRPRPPRQTFDGGALRFRVPGGLTDALRAVAEQAGCPLATVLLAAYQVLLARHADQDDFAVGVPVDGRIRPELTDLIGPFTDTVAVRADLAGDPPFTEFLARTRRTELAGLAHRDLPFAAVVAAVGHRRDASHNPIFQVLFGYGTAPERELARDLGGGVTMVPRRIANGTARAELELVLDEDGQGLMGRLHYAVALFTETTAAQLAERFVVLLGGIAAKPGTTVGALPLLPSADLALLTRWNATGGAYPRHHTVVDLIAEHARRKPDKVAVRGAGASLTYIDLDRRARAVAAQLRAAGLGRDSGAVVLVDHHPDSVAALLGVLRAGARAVPIHAGEPAARVAHVIADSGAGVVVARQGMALDPGPLPVVCVADSDSAEAGPWPSAEDVAHVVYPPGQERPTGVVVEHRAVVNLLCSLRDRLQVKATDVCAAFPSSTDRLVPDVYLPLLTGATVVLAAGPDDPELSRHGVNVIAADPPTWRRLLAAGHLPRLALCVGPQVPTAVVAALHERDAEVWILYGATETTTVATMHRVTATDVGAPPPIGTPVANTTLHVVDRAGRAVPIGAVGELYVGGAGLARGHHGRADVSDRCFRSDLPASPGTRLFRTGDLVRYRRDDTLSYVGRAGRRIRLGAYFVDPGHVEAVLCAHPSVRAARVVPHLSPGGDLHLVGHVVCDDRSVTAEDVRRHLAARLPAYQVPARLVLVPDLPADTDAGPVPPPAEPPLAADTGAVAAIVAEVLGARTVGLGDDFFRIGGSSLHAARVAGAIRARLGVPLPVEAVFERPTVAGLAAAIAERRAELAERSERVLRTVEGLPDAAAAALFAQLEISEAFGEAS
jgi:non-ribosomal peptide synthetase component F/acyl carrier protein